MSNCVIHKQLNPAVTLYSPEELHGKQKHKEYFFPKNIPEKKNDINKKIIVELENKFRIPKGKEHKNKMFEMELSPEEQKIFWNNKMHTLDEKIEFFKLLDRQTKEEIFSERVLNKYIKVRDLFLKLPELEQRILKMKRDKNHENKIAYAQKLLNIFKIFKVSSIEKLFCVNELFVGTQDEMQEKFFATHQGERLLEKAKREFNKLSSYDLKKEAREFLGQELMHRMGL